MAESWYGVEVVLNKVLPTADPNKVEEHTVFAASRRASAEENADELFTLINMLSTVFGRPDEAYAALLAAGLVLSKEFHEQRYQEFLADEQKGARQS